MASITITKPEPYCPICGAKMVLRRPKPEQDWDTFWGCSQYPDCKGTRNINSVTGKPMEPEDKNDNWDYGEDDDWGDRD